MLTGLCFLMHSSSTERTRFFRLLCIFTTLGLTGWCLYKYTLDEDVSLVAFVNFNDDEEKLYPALTICFWNPFINEKLKTYGLGINTSTYSKFIQGNFWDERMVNIDYDEVTVSLEKYMTEIGVQYGNFTTRIWKDSFNRGREHTDMPSLYVSNRNGGSKCFTFTMPYVPKVPVVSFFVRMNTDIFPNGKRTPYPNFDGSNINGGGFTTFFHLPGEHLRSYFDKKYSWPARENNSRNYDMLFTVKNMEVLKRRNKFAKQCNTEWENDDYIVMGQIMRKIGCKPPHWKLNSHLTSCSRKDEMKQFRWPTYQDLQQFPPPCNVIEKLQYEYEEVESGHLEDFPDDANVTSWFGITLFFPEPTYKEIKQAQAYDIESFVGNAGGYIGLFLGYSLMCIPSWIAKMFRKVQERGEERLRKINLKRIGCKKFTHSTTSVSVEISRLQEECRREKMEKEMNQVINVMRLLNERHSKIESKIKEIDSKLDFVLPAYGNVLENRTSSESEVIWSKRSRFYLSDEVLIK